MISQFTLQNIHNLTTYYLLTYSIAFFKIEKFLNVLMKFGTTSAHDLHKETIKSILNEPDYDLLAYLPLDLTRAANLNTAHDLIQLLSGIMLLYRLKLLKDVIPTQVGNALHMATWISWAIQTRW